MKQNMGETQSRAAFHKEMLLKSKQFRKNQEAANKTEIKHLICFETLGELYGIELTSLQEILKVDRIIKIPGGKSKYPGVINLYGQIVSILDFRQFLGKAASPVTRNSRIIILEHNDHLLGLMVDRVIEMVRLSSDRITSTTAPVTQNGKIINKYGQYKEKVILLPEPEHFFE